MVEGKQRGRRRRKRWFLERGGRGGSYLEREVLHRLVVADSGPPCQPGDGEVELAAVLQGQQEIVLPSLFT